MNIKQYDFYYKLRTLPFVEAIWLYGSRAKGTAGGRSDIDLAVLCKGASDLDWQKIREIIDTADTLRSIDCVRFDTLTDQRLRTAITQHKQVLFERKPNSYDWYEPFLDLGEAIERLGEMVNEPIDRVSYVKEATIQRFESAFELFWKILKKICKQEGFEVNSPRSTLEKAYEINLIEDESAWLSMMEDRNNTSHTYKQPMATIVYEHAKSYYAIMDKTYQRLKSRFKL